MQLHSHMVIIVMISVPGTEWGHHSHLDFAPALWEFTVKHDACV